MLGIYNILALLPMATVAKKPQSLNFNLYNGAYLEFNAINANHIEDACSSGKATRQNLCGTLDSPSFCISLERGVKIVEREGGGCLSPK